LPFHDVIMVVRNLPQEQTHTDSVRIRDQDLMCFSYNNIEGERCMARLELLTRSVHKLFHDDRKLSSSYQMFHVVW